MKTKRKKPTNKDFQRVIQSLGFDVMQLRAQVMSVSEILSDYLDFKEDKNAFQAYVEKKVESELEPVEDTNP
jgi:arylamine N-acetyltransferase